MSSNNIQEQDILNKIEREKKIIHGAQQLKSKTSNSLVIQKCMTNIRESQKNIEYLQESLRKLTLNRTKSNEQKLDAFFTLSSPKKVAVKIIVKKTPMLQKSQRPEVDQTLSIKNQSIPDLS